MANRIERFNVNVAAETVLQSQALTFEPGTVIAFEIQIPPGHHHLTGLQISYGTVPVVPRTAGSFFRGDHVHRRFELDDPFPGGGGWFADAFNNDHHYDHTFHCGVEIDPVEIGASLLPPVILLGYVDGAASAPSEPAPPGGGGPVIPV